jgi:UDP-N-acetylmuramate--alanine ligase
MIMHHPTEIDAVIRRLSYIPIKSFGSFQPHLFSRTRDFADDFAKSLSQFDELFNGYLSSS